MNVDVAMWNGRSVSSAAPCFFTTFSADFSMVPAPSMKLSGWFLIRSISFEAIHTYRA